jgi:hypothetical protein
MLKLIVTNPIVLEKLKEAYPTPPNSAAKALDKYLVEASILINDAIERGWDGFDKLFELYSIPLTVLSRDKCEIGSSKNGTRKRVHTVLKELGVSILEVKVEGCGIKRTLTKVRVNSCFAKLIKTNDRLDPKKAFDLRHPGFHKLIPIQIENDYDCLQVDIDGIYEYINTLSPNGLLPQNSSDARSFIQAHKIAAAAHHKNGILFQKKKPSIFGRTYYEGTSIQSVNKKLRKAILSDAWEYDITSSVVAWKLGFAIQYMNRKKLVGNVDDYFPISLAYVSNKKDLFDYIRLDVFKYSSISQLEQTLRVHGSYANSERWTSSPR